MTKSDKSPLTITFVIDQYANTTNGTTMTAMRSAEALRRRGHTVKILSGNGKGKDGVFTTGIRKTPILYQITKSQGMELAKADKRIMEPVIRESDIVHILMPFKFGRKAKALADRWDVPSTGAFHVQPENITSTLYLRWCRPLNTMIYKIFRRFYNRFEQVHCPSKMICEQLEKHGYRSKPHRISNGISRHFIDEAKRDRPQNKEIYQILMIGRFSREKRQDVLIRAVHKSKYKDRIKLVLAGKGPWKRHLMKLSRKLGVSADLKFFSQDELIRMMHASDVYVHASDIEIEAIACIEAFATGLVPIIADAPYSATKQFALTDHNLFSHGRPDSLSSKIDWMIDHPEERMSLSRRYIEYARGFTLESTVDALETMFKEAMEG
ncbi:MAG: glycosyltransferase [Candidatus Izemoplasmataceae bacterium]